MRSSHSYRDVHPRSFSHRQGAILLKALLVVLGTAAILAIVVPKYASAEKAGKELTIKGFLRTITAVNKEYRSRHRKYAEGLESLAREGKIEAALESAEKAGYVFSYRGGRNSFACCADPAEPGPAHFFVDQSGAIRFRADGPAKPTDEKVE